MGILDIHADELQQAGRNTPFIQPPRPTPKFSAWSMTTAAPRGVAAGAAESTGFWADITGAFGQVVAATDPLISMTAPREVREKLAQGQREAEKQLREGIDFSSEAGDLFRNVGRSYRPDAQTAHAAEELVFGFGKFATKAVGYSLAGGPVVGGALTGADEGMQAADDLRLQRVGLGTRAKVGLVNAVASAAGVAMPVAGKTLVQTAALVAAGGPLSFMGQQAASRYILENAGYEKLASQYDPLDPVGLAVSTLVPAMFGAWGMRGAVTRDGRPAPEKVPAIEPSEAHVDAARVQVVVDEQRRTSPVAPEDPIGQAQHDAAMARAEDQLAAGEPVRVTDLAPTITEAPALRDWATKVGQEVAAARVAQEVARLAEAAPVPQDQHAEILAAVDKLSQHIEQATGLPADAISRALGVDPMHVPDAATDPVGARLAEIDRQHPDLRVRLDGMDEALPMRQLLGQAHAQAKTEADHASLIDVAARCFLANGA